MVGYLPFRIRTSHVETDVLLKNNHIKFKYQGQKYFNIAPVLQDEWLTIFTWANLKNISFPLTWPCFTGMGRSVEIFFFNFSNWIPIMLSCIQSGTKLAQNFREKWLLPAGKLGRSHSQIGRSYTVHQTRIYHISRWFRCRNPVSRPVTVVSWWRPPWIPGKSTRQSAWRRTWRNYWFSGDGMLYCDNVSVRVRARNTVSVHVRARNLWLIVYLCHFCAW